MQFGGRVRMMKPAKVNWKVPYRWVLEGERAATFLKLILPYLNLKRPQAELSISFQSRRHRGAHLNDKEYRVLAEADRVVMAAFNKRGK